MGYDLRTPEGLLTLLSVPGIGPAGAIRLAQAFSTSDELGVADPELVRVALRRSTKVVPPRDAITVSDLPDTRLIGYFDQDYPQPLHDTPWPPACLWVRGTLPQPSVAVVGTRTPDAYGKRMAAICAVAAVEAGRGVVAGLALGVDAAAHSATMESGGATWAVLASGVDRPSPSDNVSLAQRILATGGGLISEYPPGTMAEPRHFVARDRIQAGLSGAVVVVQTDIPGGTLYTARFALEASRPLAVCLPDEDWASQGAAGNVALVGTDPDQRARLKEMGFSARLLRTHRLATLVVRRREDLNELWPLLER